MTIFAAKSGPSTPLGTLVENLTAEANNRGATMLPANQARRIISLESASLETAEGLELAQAVQGLRTSLESLAGSFAKDQGLEEANVRAAMGAAVIAADPMNYMRAEARSVPATEGHFIAPRSTDNMARMSKALEAYDERELRNVSVYSIAYNLQASRQDAFGEMFFPTITVAPDQYGFTMSIRLLQVYDQVRRDTSGDPSKNFGKRNIIQALIDPTLLRNDILECVPVLRAGNESNFVDTTLVAPIDVDVVGESVTTSLLKFGKKMNLLSLSQTDALLATGMLDQSDTLDSYARLKRVGVQLTSEDGATKEVIAFGNLKQIQAALFTYAVQGNYRNLTLNFTTENLVVSKDTVKIDGAASTLLDAIVKGGYTVRLGMGVFGTLNVELGDIQLTPSSVSVIEVMDKDMNVLSLKSGFGAQVVALFERAEAIGYDVETRRTNMNRREIGQNLDLTYVNQIYGVPLLGPISIPRPLTAGDQNDAGDLASLITATRIRTSNAAVAKLLEAADTLKSFVKTVGGVQLFDPEIFGPVRVLLTPFWEERDFDASTVQALTSAEKAAQIQAELVNLIRDIVFRMVRDSGWKLVADALAGGVAPNPVILLGTDPYIERYLQVTGDFRLAGERYTHRVESTYDERMAGKIFIALGDFGGAADGAPRPMHFGNMAWKPEITLILPIHRNGGNNKELTVQPSFLHVVNVPVLAQINVSGIDQVATGKVAVNFHTV